jgi:hypothetical protein
MSFKDSMATAVTKTSNYIAIDKHELIDALDLPVDVYIRLSENNYICICKKGSKFTLEGLHATQDEAVRVLFVLEEDHPELLNHNLKISKQLAALPRIRPETSLKIHSTTFSSVMHSMDQFGISDSSFSASKEIAKSILDNVQKKPDIHQLVLKIESLGPLSVQKTMLTTILAISVALLMGMQKDRIELLALACLLHDLGLKEVPKSILEKSRIDLTAEERAYFETHPYRGAELISHYIPEAPQELIQVALQHHELGNGMGFPCGLDHLKLHPFSRIVSACDWIADSLVGFSYKEKRMSYKEIIEASVSMAIPINQQVYTIMKNLAKRQE